MPTCANCNTFIAFGGKRANNQIYCNDRCLQAGQLAEAATQIDPTIIRQQVEKVFRGPCPKCSRQNGPVDLRKSHTVFSALVFTRWATKSAVSCKSCAAKTQIGAIFFSGLAGWWGFPWGIIMTPIQLVRNASELLSHNLTAPSPQLERAVRLQLGAQHRANNPK